MAKSQTFKVTNKAQTLKSVGTLIKRLKKNRKNRHIERDDAADTEAKRRQ